MGRPRLLPEERKQRKEENRNKMAERCRKKQVLGVCRDCDQKVCSESRVFCHSHLKRHRVHCKKAAKKLGKYKSIRNNALKKGRTCLPKLQFEQWIKTQPKKCRYCGIAEKELERWRDKKKKRLTVDRMDNSKGYDVENICLACYKCNNLKSDFFTETEWEKICDEYIKPRINEYQNYT